MALPLFYKIFSTEAAERIVPHKGSTPNKEVRPLSLVFLHGYFASHSNMIGVLQHFRTLYAKKHVHFYLIDIRNHGQSPHHENISYDAMAGDIEAVMLLENLQNAVLIGHSMGGKIAMTLATRERVAVKKLIISDIAPCEYPQAHSEGHVAKLYALKLSDFSSREAVSHHLAQSMPNETLRSFFLKNLRIQAYSTDSTSDPSTPQDAPARLYWQCNLPVLYKNRNEVIKAIPQPKGTRSAYLTKLPVLFIRGQTSPYLGDRELATIEDYFSNYTVQTFPKTGHWVHFEQPARFAQASYDFIED